VENHVHENKFITPNVIKNELYNVDMFEYNRNMIIFLDNYETYNIFKIYLYLNKIIMFFFYYTFSNKLISILNLYLYI
jgi:hypothetical protein